MHNVTVEVWLRAIQMAVEAAPLQIYPIDMAQTKKYLGPYIQWDEQQIQCTFLRNMQSGQQVALKCLQVLRKQQMQLHKC